MNKLLHGDCLELMKDIKDKSIDMILCDLPYGTTQNKWDCIIPLDLLWTQYKRIIKDNGAIVLFSQMPFTATLVASNLKMFKYEWIWDKVIGTGFLNAKKAPLKSHENIVVFYKRLPVYNPQMRTGFKPYSMTSGSKSINYGTYHSVNTSSDGERYPVSILEYSNASHKDRLHPTQKPVTLLEYLIKTYTNENDFVLDPFMGSGSTGVACINTHRNFIGIEINAKYYETAKTRLISQKKLYLS